MSPTEPAGYAEAAAELESILARLDGEELDVDALAGHVERASLLIRFCRARIEAARVEVEKVVADFDPPEDTTPPEDGVS